jgi:hypothetical protein
MARVASQKTRQALLDLEGIFDPTRVPDKLALFDANGNLINLQSGGGMEVYEQLAEPDTTTLGAIWIKQEPS